MPGAATQIAETGFDKAFFRFPPARQAMIQAKIDEMGERLGNFPHHKLTNSPHYRLRAGDYRVIYTFDAEMNEIHLRQWNIAGRFTVSATQVTRTFVVSHVSGVTVATPHGTDVPDYELISVS
jgi:mRNA-degrading endonuclease RelE of RelBE toxin-antitoxin system